MLPTARSGAYSTPSVCAHRCLCVRLASLPMLLLTMTDCPFASLGGRIGATDQSISNAFQWFDGAGWAAWYSGAIPSGVAAGLLMVHNDQLYLIGGQTAPGVGSGVVHVFDGTTWTLSFSVPTANGLPAHWGAAGASYGGEIWLAIPKQGANLGATVLYRSNNNGGPAAIHLRHCVSSCLRVPGLTCLLLCCVCSFSLLHSAVHQDDQRIARPFGCDDDQRLSVALGGDWLHCGSVSVQSWDCCVLNHVV